MIRVGDRIPSATLFVMQGGRPSPVTTDEIFAGRKIVLFAVPGAFTPTCSEAHLPGFVANADKIKAKGVDRIVCVSVNDAFVMDAWGRDRHAGELVMAADGNAEFTRALGLDMDATGFGLGTRSRRYAMIVDDGVITRLNVDAPGKFDVSRAEAILEAL
jgi:glutaredoxin/glutathione-dependent peroxiredoxin